jgi:hypothetical protein
MKREQKRTEKADEGEQQETEGNNLAKPPDVFLCEDFRPQLCVTDEEGLVPGKPGNS